MSVLAEITTFVFYVRSYVLGCHFAVVNSIIFFCLVLKTLRVTSHLIVCYGVVNNCPFRRLFSTSSIRPVITSLRVSCSLIEFSVAVIVSHRSSFAAPATISHIDTLPPPPRHNHNHEPRVSCSGARNELFP